MAIITYLFGAVLMCLILWGSVPFFYQSWTENFYVGVEGMFTAPRWPIVLIVVIAVFVTLIQFLVILMDHWRQLTSRM